MAKISGKISEMMYWDLPKRIPINIEGELALEKEERTGKIDLQNFNIMNVSFWRDGMTCIEYTPCACAEVNGESREFFMTFFSDRKSIEELYDKPNSDFAQHLKQYLKYRENYIAEPAIVCRNAGSRGVYSKQGNDFHMIPIEKRIWVTEQWFGYFSDALHAGGFYIIEQCKQEGISKAKPAWREISDDVYNRFFQTHQPTQPLPHCILKAEDISASEGFMITQPSAYAEIDGEQQAFYLAFSKTENKSGEIRYRFEGVYSKTGVNVFSTPANSRKWEPIDKFALSRPILSWETRNKRIYLHP